MSARVQRNLLIRMITIQLRRGFPVSLQPHTSHLNSSLLFYTYVPAYGAHSTTGGSLLVRRVDTTAPGPCSPIVLLLRPCLWSNLWASGGNWNPFASAISRHRRRLTLLEVQIFHSGQHLTPLESLMTIAALPAEVFSLLKKDPHQEPPHCPSVVTIVRRVLYHGHTAACTVRYHDTQSNIAAAASSAYVDSHASQHSQTGRYSVWSLHYFTPLSLYSSAATQNHAGCSSRHAPVQGRSDLEADTGRP
jgi:hypothetical protein